MRPSLALLATVLSLSLSAPARADKCADACGRQSKTCKQRCDKTHGTNKKKLKECLGVCDDQAILCPEMCAVAKRNKGNPQQMKREAEQVLRSHENHGGQDRH